MCGIAGVVSYGAAGIPVDRPSLLAARDQMERRGPDGAGVWMSGSGLVGLAHRRLSIIDLSEAGAQPMVCGDGRYVIVFNGEIYNYRELRRLLLSKGFPLRSNCDTEVLPYLYELDGVDMFLRLRGMFSFGLWDTRAGEIVLARDPLGIKPLYYSDDGQQVWFASQVKALLAGGVDSRPDAGGHVGYHIWGHVPEPFTLYKNIQALPAGHYLKLRMGGKPEVKPYWSLRQVLEGVEPGRGGQSADADPQGDESLRDLLKKSVTDHLVADVPVGIFLSAGRDSTTLLALASEEQSSDLHTLTMGFQEFRGTPNDELPLAKVAAERYGAKHEEVVYTERDRQLLMDPFLARMDQPTVDGFNIFMVSQAARMRGLKVALSGVGADEAFLGYSSFLSIPKLVRRTRPLNWLPGVGKAFRVVTGPLIKARANPKYASLLEMGNKVGEAYLLRRGMYMPWELPAILDGDLVREGMRRLRPLVDLNAIGNAGNVDIALRLVCLEFQYYLRNQLLRDTDWASMAHSLEVRTPFVDARLLEGLVKHANRYGWPNKALMAATPRRKPPAELLNRPKTGFGIPSFNARREQRIKGEPPQRTWAREVYLNYVLPAPTPVASSTATAVCVS